MGRILLPPPPPCLLRKRKVMAEFHLGGKSRRQCFRAEGPPHTPHHTTPLCVDECTPKPSQSPGATCCSAL